MGSTSNSAGSEASRKGADSSDEGVESSEYEQAVREAERALVERRHISIRLRIAVGLGVCFLLTAAVTVASLVSLNEVRTSQEFLEKVSNYALELDQARRYEKNYFLYGSNLDDALSEAHTAHLLLRSADSSIRKRVGAEEFERVETNLEVYTRLLDRLHSLRNVRQGPSRDERADIERELRRHGAQLLLDAGTLVDQERLRMHTILRSSKLMGTAALIVVLLMIVFIGNLLTRQILTPIGRFLRHTKRIAAGDYAPILPKRRFRDELSDLALAVNQMVRQLRNHEAKLARTSRMAAVGTLTAGVAHELNNPLNNISLDTEAMLENFEDYTDDEKKKMLRDILTHVERAGGTVRNLLDFTRQETPVFVSTSIADIVERGVRLMTNEAALSDVRFDVELPPDLPLVRGNPRSLEQVCLNLFLNAIQAMPRGGTLSVRAAPAEGDMVRLDVTDTGVGISEDHLASVFDPFFTTKEVGVGTGLGLSVTYGIIQNHHGSIEVKSKVDSGTTFSIYLPRSSDDGAKHSATDQP